MGKRQKRVLLLLPAYAAQMEGTGGENPTISSGLIDKEGKSSYNKDNELSWVAPMAGRGWDGSRNFENRRERKSKMEAFTNWVSSVSDFIWGPPLIVLILACGIWLTIRTGLLQVFHLGKALRYMFQDEEDGDGEVTSFGALCTALSATIGTGNIVGVASAIAAGGPGALLWMEVAAFFGMATKYAEGLLAIKYREVDQEGHVLGGPFYYIEKGMGKNWKWLGKLFALFGLLAGALGIGTITQINGITSAAETFFDPQ